MTKLRLKDNNGINTTKNITVNVWANASGVAEPTTVENNRSNYTFKWNSTVQTWYGPTYTDTYVSNASSTNVNGSDYGTENSTYVNITFRLAEIAVPTNATSGWKINVTVEDEDGNFSYQAPGWTTTHSRNESAFNVSSYSELSANESSIHFGSANPGAEVGNLSAANTNYQTNVTLSANTQTNVTVTGQNFERVGGGAATLDVTRFYFNTTNTTIAPTGESGGKNVVQLSTGAQNGYTAFRNVTDTLGILGIEGYTDNKELGLAFNGSIPWVARAGSYTATWTITAATAPPTE